VKREVKREEVNEQPARNANQGDEALDIPTFLRNRNRRR
jgi:cell division protein FtsZ